MGLLPCEKELIMILILFDKSQEEINMKIGGPFLIAALFCEKVLHEKDGVLSLIRVVDRFTHTNTPDKMPAFPIQISILLGLRSGDIKGKQEVVINPITPSGKTLPKTSLPVLFEGADQGANLNITYAFVAEEEGLYWFDIILNGNSITKMPLRITYQKTQTAGGTDQPLQ
jgi:hypothetical protein